MLGQRPLAFQDNPIHMENKLHDQIQRMLKKTWAQAGRLRQTLKY